MQRIPDHNNNFDFLRWLFASFVIFSHSYALLGDIRTDPVYRLTGRALSEIGVCGFFVISGYLIHQSLERSRSLTAFIMKRLKRILPGLFIAILATTLFIGPLVTTFSPTAYFSDKATWFYTFGNMVLVPGQSTLPGVFEQNTEKAVNGSLWTLRYELLCYGLLCLLYKVAIPGKKVAATGALLLCLGGYFALHYSGYDLHLPLYKFLFYCCVLGGYFASGTILSLYRWQQKKTSMLLCSTLLFLLTSLIRLPALEILNILSFSLMVISFGLHYFPLLHFSRYTGDISYGTYIYAYPLQQALIVWLHPGSPLSLLFPSLLAAWLAGWLSWHLVERRFLRKRALAAAGV